MSKFKVGDKFLVVDAGAHYSVKKGDVVSLYRDDGSSLKYYEKKDGGIACIADSRLKPLSTTNTLQVGETYTSENGREWECVFVRGDKAWMIGLYPDGAYGNAYDFEIDGTASWAGGHGADGYNIKWGPKRETINTKASWAKKGVPHPNHYHYNITFDLIDGHPDWSTAKVSPCD